MTQRANDLPKFDGQVVRMSTRLRALRQTEHHLPDDVAFFVRTGAKVNSNGTLSVASVKHALLLHYDLLEQCGFDITAPLPVVDRFEALYDNIRAGNAGFTASGVALPETTDALPDALAAIASLCVPTLSGRSTSSTAVCYSARSPFGTTTSPSSPWPRARVGRTAYASAPQRIRVEHSRMRS